MYIATISVYNCIANAHAYGIYAYIHKACDMYSISYYVATYITIAIANDRVL